MIRRMLRGPLARSKTVVALRQHWGMLPAVVGGYRRAAGRSWSQHGEDNVLVDILRDEMARGFYVDVGANHPAVLSNTFRLYCMGMRGITIEPNDTLCAFHARYRPGDQNVCAGIGERDGLLEYYELNYHAFSTFSLAHVRHCVGHGSKLIRRRLKPIFRLETILRDVRFNDRERFSLLSVDTEGFDEIVLRSNNWDLQHPGHVLVEYYSDRARERISGLLKDLGYDLVQTFGCNGLYETGAGAPDLGGADAAVAGRVGEARV